MTPTWKYWTGTSPVSTYITMKPGAWDHWTTNTATITTTVPYETKQVWGTWNGEHYVYKVPDYKYTTGTNTTAWQTWNERYVSKLVGGRVDPMYEAQRQAAEIEVAARLARQATARDKAKVLLKENLSVAQQAMMKRHGYFHVRSQHGKIYRIYTNRSDHNNIYEVDRQGRQLRQLCAQPRGGQPYEDSWLAQKLTLELAEDAFLAAAYKYEIRNAREQGAVCNLEDLVPA